MGVFYKEVSPDITKNRDPWKVKSGWPPSLIGQSGSLRYLASLRSDGTQTIPISMSNQKTSLTSRVRGCLTGEFCLSTELSCIDGMKFGSKSSQRY